MSLTHAQKVLILVSVPLIFQLGLVGSLAFLFNQAETETGQGRRTQWRLLTN